MSTHRGGKIAVFVGPTAYGVGHYLRTLDHRFTLLPPVKRGDILMLPPCFRSVVIVDGLFHTVPAVGHIELRKALDERTVYGCSSMGAIRAYEMRDMGMIGHGWVYRAFLEHDDFGDDEVALLHGPSPDYRPLSEPLVNIRYYMKYLASTGLLRESHAAEIVAEMKRRYYGHRTIGAAARLLGEIAGRSAIGLLNGLHQRRIKTIDFVSLLEVLQRER